MEVNIPSDINECLKFLDKILTDSEKEKIKTCNEMEYSLSYHFSIGLWIRNNWVLAIGSPLSRYFNKFFVHNPDSISDIILTAYYRHIHCQEIKFEELIKFNRDF